MKKKIASMLTIATVMALVFAVCVQAEELPNEELAAQNELNELVEEQSTVYRLSDEDAVLYEAENVESAEITADTFAAKTPYSNNPNWNESTSSELKAKYLAGENFLFTVYSPACAYCRQGLHYIEGFMNCYNAPVYALNHQEESVPSFVWSGLEGIDGYIGLAVGAVYNGKVTITVTASKDKKRTLMELPGLLWDFANQMGYTPQNNEFAIEDGVLKAYNGPGGNVVIPNTVTRIANGAFLDSMPVQKLTIPGSVKTVESLRGVFQNKDTQQYYGFFENTFLNSVVMEEGVENLEKYAFWGCGRLASFHSHPVDISAPASLSSCGYGCIETSDPKNITVYAPTGSAAGRYATSQGFNYVPDGKPATEPATNPTAQPTAAPTMNPEGTAGFVDRLYTICLGRAADANGKADWVNQLTSYRISGAKAAYGFIFSKEFTSKNYSNADYVEHLYAAFMGRGSDAAGKTDWVNQLQSGKSREEVFYGFANSVEFDGICTSYGIVSKDVETFVTRFYSVCLDRKPDAVGLANWSNALRGKTQTGRNVAQGFVFSKEFQNKQYGNQDYVEHLYAAFMGRAADAAGKADWVNQLQNGKSREDVFNGFVGSKEFSDICAGYNIERG